MYTVIVFALAAALVAQTARAAGELRIVALGDSLTSGHGLGRGHAYPAVLEASLREAGLPYSVVNHGISGDTTAGGLRRVEAALAEKPQILIVALGANDGLRGVPVATVKRNLEQIIEAAQARGVSVLLCGMDALPLYGWQYTMDFHNIYPELAKKYGVPLVPFLLTGVVANQAMLLPDMIHPNIAGARAIATNIWPYLQRLAAGSMPANGAEPSGY
jgi:acyl-CoA thioesterase-1